MTRAEAVGGLRTSITHQRLNAARFFIEHGTPEDLPLLRQAKQAESDSYVSRRLDQAILAIDAGHASGGQEDSDDVDGSLDKDLLAKSFEWVGGLLMHEMEGPIGRAAFYASKEITAYVDSKTKRELDSLKLIFNGIEQIVKASQPPKPVEIDVSALIEALVSYEVRAPIVPSIIGKKPFVLTVDPALLQFAIVNGLKNATESIESVGGSNQEHPLVVTWGSTDRDNWISIIDQGPGVTGSINAKFDIGRSTKAGHRGFGLAIARRAMESMRGTVTLTPGNGRGAQYEIRWAKAL